MKYLANILTVSRIVLALILLLFFGEISVPFLVIYFIAQLTDMVDGTIARKTNTCSTEGAILDTAADVLLVSNVVKMAFKHKILSKSMKIWLLISLCIATISPIISLVRFGKPYYIHSLSSKILGGSIMFVPVSTFFGFAEPYIVLVLILFTYSMIENAIMNLMLKKPDSDVLTINAIIRQNKAMSVE